MNLLSQESSPYLFQHKDNPVHWQPWSEEAFLTAAVLDKPVIVSIGYSTCHWCHVMEHESFEDHDVAALMNDHFICIKVDREERPDIDDIYMKVCQMISGSGGWPLNCFLLPDKRPFYAGTYYPPRPAHGRISWPQLLIQLSNLYRNEKEKIFRQADQIMSVLNGIQNNISSIILNNSSDFNFDQAKNKIINLFDPVNGGFGSAPKFPAPANYNLGIQFYLQQGDKAMLHHTLLSASHMVTGAMYDHLRGGFARYSVDAHWHVPHFEKMLYDNAGLITLYAFVYRLTAENWLKAIVLNTVHFFETFMLSPTGLYFAAMDADTDGKEGTYYVWSSLEINNLPEEIKIPLFENVVITPEGNWENTNVLRFISPEQMRLYYNQTDSNNSLFKSFMHLKELAQLRSLPHINSKILSSWNAQMGIALCDAGQYFSDQTLIEKSIGLYSSFKKTQIINGSLIHSSADERHAEGMFLEDHAWLIYWLLQLGKVTLDTTFFDTAVHWLHIAESLFYDSHLGLFYNTPATTKMIIRNIELQDNVTSSANSIMLKNYAILALLNKNDDFQYKYTQMANAFKAISQDSVYGYLSALSTIYWFENENEIILLSGPLAKSWANELMVLLKPESLIRIIENEADSEKLKIPLESEKTLIYRCKDFACQFPADDLQQFINTYK